MKKNRVLICEFHQESNTFNPIVMPPERFNAGGPVEGPEVFAARMATASAVHGAVDTIAAMGGEVIPTVFMTASSGGRVDDRTLVRLKDRLADYIETAGEFDALYASLHGATCTESSDDACGDLLEFLRGLVGEKPIAATFDLHANITQKLLTNADFICGYNTYPHTDYYETGCRAASLLMGKLTGRKDHVATAAVPMLIPPAGYTTLNGPFKVLMDSGKAQVQAGRLRDFSIFPVQPWLDIPEITSRVITVAEDPEIAKQEADRMAKELFALREDVQPPMLTVDQIIDIAEENTSGQPVILADSADSPNGGAVGDSPAVALALQARGSKLRVGMFVKDPKGVEQAFRLGVGGQGEFSVGASYTVGMPGPFVAQGTVRSLHDGSFVLEGPGSRGKHSSLGLSAVVSFGNIDILLVHDGASSGNPQLFRHFGIEPKLYDMIVVKANTSFRVPYSSISELIYCADTPGAGASNLAAMQFTRLPKGIYPKDLPVDYVLEPAALI